MFLTPKTIVLAGLVCVLPVALPGAMTGVALAAPASASESTASQLLQGVGAVRTASELGAISVYGPTAFPVLSGQGGRTRVETHGVKSWQPLEVPVVGASVAGETRVVAIGSASFWSARSLDTEGNARFFTNLLRWVSESKARKRLVFGVMDEGAPSLVGWLGTKGFATAPATLTLKSLGSVDVLILNAQKLTTTDLPPLQAFLARGGKLIIAANGGTWMGANSYYDGVLALASDFAGNELLRPYGLAFSRTAPDFLEDEAYPARVPTALTSGSRALQVAADVIGGGLSLTGAETAQLGLSLKEMAFSLSPRDTVVLPQLKALANRSAAVVPFERQPVTINEPGPRLALLLQTALVNKTPLTEMKPSPAGALFPGDVPVKPVATPVNKTLTLTTEKREWQSTGLYAAPGVPITVTIPPELADKGLSLRIGAHTDGLWGLDSWKRPPAISRVTPLREAKTTFVNPYGGLVYIVIPAKTTTHPGRIYATRVPQPPYGGGNPVVPDLYPHQFDVSIDGAFEAPFFDLGKTSIDEWKTRIRNSPGPWAELQGRNIVLTVPSRNVRDIDDPAAVVKIYDDALDLMADFVAWPRDARKRRERMVVDTQISVGYMHAGYPIMMQMDQEKRAVDVAGLQERSWGQWHELGHNHQSTDWTMDGTVEVTNNLFALYVMEKMYGRPLHEAISNTSVNYLATEWPKYEAAKFDYAYLKSNPWLYLHMYGQLREAFGWDAFQKVFAQYNELPDAQRPKSDAEKRDQWMVRFSRVVGKNLGPFFEKWHVPTTQAARDSIQDLPVWMPEWPPIPATVKIVSTP